MGNFRAQSLAHKRLSPRYFSLCGNIVGTIPLAFSPRSVFDQTHVEAVR